MPKAIRQPEPDTIDPYKKIPKRKVPWEPKTYVTGCTRSGMLGPVDHRHHGGLFQVVWRMKIDEAVPSNSGWHVILRCVACDVRTTCDGEFAMVRANDDHVMKWLLWAAKICRDMGRALEEVEKKWPQVTA